MKLSSFTQGALPTYLSSSFGLDGSYSFLVKPLNLGLYGRAAADYVYHASTGGLYLGPEVSLGLKLSF